jgi:hypothetical protein
MAGSFFGQGGYSPSTITSFEALVTTAIQSSGAIGPKSVTIINPSGTDDLTLFYVNAACTVQQITASVKGTDPSITIDITYGSTPEAAGTSLVTGGIVVTSETITTTFDNASIPADSYVRLVTSARTGDVTELAISMDF